MAMTSLGSFVFTLNAWALLTQRMKARVVGSGVAMPYTSPANRNADPQGFERKTAPHRRIRAASTPQRAPPRPVHRRRGDGVAESDRPAHDARGARARPAALSGRRVMGSRS